MRTKALILSVVAILMLATPTLATEIWLEAGGTKALKKCDNLHHIATCDVYHWTPAKTSGTGREERSGLLNEQPAEVEWTGMGYYLSSGQIVLQNEEGWFEVYPNLGLVHAAGTWQGRTADGALQVSDMLSLGAESFKVRDIRRLVRVKLVE